ncbi:MATH and LRR domain-containing protein PFE0570w [Microplitis mediator]|uniref:MATH and LRR domain-containing protein PFE0570w n=1 Tax=Microplitis mediator TaxID=375433 RepID=UPI0025562097|nr:MATH and LRR domain-containing protein PFE0570w [Microplitis mediator]
MHSENCPSVSFNDDSEVPSVHSTINLSTLEEDLAISSSTLDTRDKTSEETEPEYVSYKSLNKVIYLNEETMDCNYSESTETPKKNKILTQDLTSPELFKSDDEDDVKPVSKNFKRILSQPTVTKIIPRKLTQDELIIQSDSYLLTRTNKFLTGVPPPPKLTICQSDCTDFLSHIRKNRKYFWVDPFNKDDDKILSSDEVATNTTTTSTVTTTTTTTDDTDSTIFSAKSDVKKIISNESNERISLSRSRSLRNLTNAFDACDQSNSSASVIRTEISNDSAVTDCCSSTLTNNTNTSMETFNERVNNNSNCNINVNNNNNNLNESELSNLSSITASIASISTTEATVKDNVKHVTFDIPQDEEHLGIFRTIDDKQAKSLPWPIIYKHKAPGIHYNRNKFIEEFENLSTKLCERYVGNETQSTCTIWFTKQAPGSAKKRMLLGKRGIGQSPGKRLSHLARRRKTFSSANLQGMAEKKQIVLNVKKPIIKKGKSPRGKSPRGKSPRGKSPRNSAKKRLSRKLLLEGPSPRKTKLETSKRALFQSPTNDRAGPSGKSVQMGISNPQKIKRALFPTPQKKEGMSNAEEVTKKRKSDEELEAPRVKWPKSLSFDCTYNNLDSSRESWSSDRYSSSNVHMKSETMSQPVKVGLSDNNKKKLLWAVYQALQSRGINMEHPKFKQYANQLARTVRKYMPDLENRNIPRKPGSTCDRMLKLANIHVLLVVEAKCD